MYLKISPCPLAHEDNGDTERLMRRARMALDYGVDPQDLPAYLAAKGVSPEEAFLITKAALILWRETPLRHYR